MIFTNDIGRYVGDALIAEGYDDIRLVSINVIEEKIKEFLRMKLNETNEELDIIALLTRLESFMDDHNKDQMMSNFTFYLLWYISMLQGFEIIWKIEDIDSPKFVESTFVLGKVDALVTSKKINYVSTFNYVLGEARKIYYEMEGRGR